MLLTYIKYLCIYLYYYLNILFIIDIMDTIDIIYILNLNKNYIRKDMCINQLKQYNITNYEFIDSINPSETLYENMYYSIIKHMDKKFIYNNFTLGAFGCFLTHIECIKQAKMNNYKQIIVLEDDFLFKHNFLEEFNKFYENLVLTNPEWDLIYLGKKQGNDGPIKINNTNTLDINKKIHKNEAFFYTKKVNDMIYKPSYRTWGTHGLFIKNTIFDEIINYQKNIIAPIDLMLMTSFDRYNIYCLYNDLIISTDSNSDILTIKKSESWNWNNSLYYNQINNNIKNIVIYGFYDSFHTHSYIHEMYYHFFLYYYPELNIYWVNNISKLALNYEETIIFLSPSHAKIEENLPDVANFIIHLDEFNHLNFFDDFYNDNNNKKIIENNKYIILTCRDNVKNVKYFNYNIESKIICLPWFSNVLYKDLPRLNYEDLPKKKYLLYFGSIWDVNIDMIIELMNICEKNKIHLLIKGRAFGIGPANFKILNSIEEKYKYVKRLSFMYDSVKKNENNFEYLKNNYEIKGILPLQGEKHNSNYVSNRIIETISNGYIIVTNNSMCKNIFKSSIYYRNLEELVLEYNKIINDTEKYARIYQEQYKEFIHTFYGYNIIHNVMNFFQDINRRNNRLFYYSDNNKLFVIWFRMYDKDNRYFININNNDEIRHLIKNNEDAIIIINDEIDPFLIDRLISMSNSKIYCDEEMTTDQFKKINELCLKYDKKLYIKNKLQNYCIVSSNYAETNKVIKYLQKHCTNYLTFNEIFSSYENCISGLNHIINKSNVNPFHNYDNDKYDEIFDYFKQFIDICEYKNLDGIIFTALFDFFDYNNIKSDKYTNIFLLIKKYCKIIYVKRNPIDMYITCMTDNIDIKNNIFSLKELYNFVEKENLYLSHFVLNNFYNFITYETIIDNLKNNNISFLKIPIKLLDNFLIDYDFSKENNNTCNINELMNIKYWKL